MSGYKPNPSTVVVDHGQKALNQRARSSLLTIEPDIGIYIVQSAAPIFGQAAGFTLVLDTHIPLWEPEDICLVMTTHGNDSDIWAPLETAGWTLTHLPNSTAESRICLWWRILEVGDTGASFSWQNSSPSHVFVVLIRGANTLAQAHLSTPHPTITWPSVTTGGPSLRIAHWSRADASYVLTGPEGWTLGHQFVSGSSQHGGWYWRITYAIGETGTFEGSIVNPITDPATVQRHIALWAA